MMFTLDVRGGVFYAWHHTPQRRGRCGEPSWIAALRYYLFRLFNPNYYRGREATC